MKVGRQFSDGPERYTTHSVQFAHAFTLGRESEVYPAGIYQIETKEEAHEAAGHTAYVRTSTVLIIATRTGTRHYAVKGNELDEALLRDAHGDDCSEPSENPDRGCSTAAS